MNNQNIPFADLESEMEALQQRSEDYQGKIAALKLVNRELNKDEIRRLSQLDNQCQSFIAYCFSRRQPPIQ